MIILAIETSCDDTSVSVVKIMGTKNPKFTVLANEISSQIKVHAPFGGVVPGLASREHLKNLPLVFKKALKNSGIKLKDIDYITTAIGPGLVVALLIGVNFARTLAYSLNKKIIPVHHISGHIYSNWLANKKIDFPVLNLTVSGGHTELILMKKHLKYERLGSTRDDAAGEAFDKVAKLLGLGYPGGPIISKLAEKGDPKKYELPRPMMHSKDFDFSFSGLKTAVLYSSQKHPEILKKGKVQNDFCASFQQAAIDVLIHKTIKAAKKYKVRYILLAGGVSANNELRKQLKKSAKENGFKFLVPEKIFSTDNAAMIAVSAYFNIKKAQSWKKIDADPNLELK
jgi:N6-L-threonylcarbamoyladenine synthase